MATTTTQNLSQKVHSFQKFQIKLHFLYEQFHRAVPTIVIPIQKSGYPLGFPMPGLQYLQTYFYNRLANHGSGRRTLNKNAVLENDQETVTQFSSNSRGSSLDKNTFAQFPYALFYILHFTANTEFRT